MKKVIIFIFFFCTTISAQNFKLGFDIEVHQVRINQGTGILGGTGLPMSIHVNVDYNIIKNFSLQAKIGRTFHQEFLGWEYGINGNYKFFKSLYISGGYLIHSNVGGIGGISSGTNYATLSLIKVGVGIKVIQAFSIEAGYYIPISRKIIGWINNYGPISYYTFDNMIRLSFVFGWTL